MLPDFTNLSEVLAWIAIGGGAPYLVMMALSYLAEMWPAWHDFPKAVKVLVPPIVAILIAFGANYALQASDIIASLSPIWVMIVQVIIAWVGSQQGYMDTKAAKFGAHYPKPGV